MPFNIYAMYETFYGLKEKPFQIVSNPQYLFLSPAHENALTYLEYGLIENVGFILLTGEVGAGKTTLVGHIVNQFKSKKEIGVIFNTNVTSDDLIYLVMQSFNLQPKNGNKIQNLEVFQKYLIDRHAQNKHVLLIIDEAQNLSDDAIEEVRMFSNIQRGNQNLLQIMLVGQPELKERLLQSRHAPFAQRIAVNFFLTGLSEEETGAYIAHRLKKAGGEPVIFDKEAVSMIYQASGGIPRSINLMCDTALVYGFGYELRIINKDVIEQVLRDKGGIGLHDNEKEVKDTGINQFEFVENDIDLLMEKLDKANEMILELKGRVGVLEKMPERELKKQLTKERNRNDQLLAKHAKLKAKYSILLNIWKQK